MKLIRSSASVFQFSSFYPFVPTTFDLSGCTSGSRPGSQNWTGWCQCEGYAEFARETPDLHLSEGKKRSKKIVQFYRLNKILEALHCGTSCRPSIGRVVLVSGWCLVTLSACWADKHGWPSVWSALALSVSSLLGEHSKHTRQHTAVTSAQRTHIVWVHVSVFLSGVPDDTSALCVSSDRRFPPPKKKWINRCPFTLRLKDW